MGLDRVWKLEEKTRTYFRGLEDIIVRVVKCAVDKRCIVRQQFPLSIHGVDGILESDFNRG